MRPDDRPVLILGAGINGAALARELVLNRVPVCVVDTADLAGGTTAYSSRLIHGGLRYLEYGELDLVRESLDERNRLLAVAPHLVRPLRLFIPVRTRFGGIGSALPRLLGWRWFVPRQSKPRGLWLVRWGLWFYDTYAAASSSLPRRQLHRAEDGAAPKVDAGRFPWLCSYYDAQVRFPELMTLAMLQDARQIADAQRTWFRVLTYHQAHLRGRRVEIGPMPSAEADRGSVDRSDKKVTCELEPSVIINATGAWVDETLRRLRVDSPRLIAGTTGSHLLIRHERLHATLAGDGIYAEAADGRPVFILPLGDATLVGTTDLPFTGDPREVIPSGDEVDYLLGTVNQIFPELGISARHVELRYCGVRPLPSSTAGTTAAITRRHWLEENDDSTVPLYSVIGGKLTTCRSLAEQAAATVLTRTGRSVTANSRTRPIPGGENFPSDSAELDQQIHRIAAETRTSSEQVRAVWMLCGTRTEQILHESKQFDSQQGARRGDQNLPGTPLPCSFVRWVIRNQWVTTLQDLIERRLMLLFTTQISSACLHRLAELLVQEGRLAPESADDAVQQCVQRLQHHFGKQAEPLSSGDP